jgi:hypothetical protein
MLESDHSSERVAQVLLVGLNAKLFSGSVKEQVVLATGLPILVVESSEETELRVVGFDESGTRSEFARWMSISGPTLQCGTWQAELKEKGISHVGIEQITVAGRKQLSLKASEELAKQGVTLGYPVQGEAFPFVVKGTTQSPIRSADF